MAPTGVNLGMEKYVEENMATVPPEGTMENVLQEVTSIVSGGGAGGAIVKGLTKFKTIKKGADKLGDIGEGLYNIWKGTAKDAISAAERTQAFRTAAKAFLIERGVTLGGTIAEPDIEPFFDLSEQTIAAAGFNPDELTGLRTYIDNELFNGVMGGIIKVAKAGFGGVKQLAGYRRAKANVTNEKDAQKIMALRMFQDLDSGLKDVAEPDLKAFRMGILAEVLDKYKTFDLEGLANINLKDVPQLNPNDDAIKNLPAVIQDSLFKGEIPLDTATALVSGSREYAEKAYAGIKGLWQRQNPNGNWDAFLDEKANEVSANILSLRKGRALANKEFAQGVTKLEEVAVGRVGEAADTLAEGASNKH